MYTFLHKQVEPVLNKYINNREHILVALSSGQDSLCLLKLLKDLVDQDRHRIKAAYIDHQWKNNSKKHAHHVANIGKFIGLPVAIYQIKRVALSENEARRIRYQILIKHALEENCSTIIIGHNRDDLIETLINNLLRGTGINGITSFTECKKAKNKLSVLRPLIYFSKIEIKWLCRLFHLPSWSDETNYNLNLKRNRARYEFIPYTQNFFNPKIKESLANFSKLCREDNEYVKENTLKLYIKSKHSKLLCINLQIIKKQHPALQKRAIRLYFYYHFNTVIKSSIVNWILTSENKYTHKEYCNSCLSLQIFNNWLYAYLI